MDYENEQYTAEEEVYIPRPRWQVWSARVGLVIAIFFVILQILQIYTGGLI